MGGSSPLRGKFRAGDFRSLFVGRRAAPASKFTENIEPFGRGGRAYAMIPIGWKGWNSTQPFGPAVGNSESA